ncbi:hypothetical protein OSB04_005877 [Centaurea solstitialis]|uniref:Pentatricopeptide repeat-containing protein n=1 Tax=Centaurea solstitialis TaxID=347529 RepID=A0AA38WH65_9ASTR|nr:hypothetical protein OSB04_005877 [Centaurea solstitialis]
MNMVIRSMNSGGYGTVSMQTRMCSSDSFVEFSNLPSLEIGKNGRGSLKKMRITMRDRGKNRKPLQKGRNLSIEAIQTIQALKRASSKFADKQQEVIHSKFSRLLKFDMMAILRELLRQDHSILALMVFAEIQKEHWYKPEVSLYAEIISVLARNNLYDKVDVILLELKSEKGRLEGKTDGFNVLMENLTSYNMTQLAMDCFELMKEIGCEPDRSTFKLLVRHLESKGESGLSLGIREEARKYYGDFLDFLDEQEDLVTS